MENKKKCPHCGTYDEFISIDYFEIDEGVFADIRECLYCNYSTIDYYEEGVDNLENKWYN